MCGRGGELGNELVEFGCTCFSLVWETPLLEQRGADQVICTHIWLVKSFFILFFTILIVVYERKDRKYRWEIVKPRTRVVETVWLEHLRAISHYNRWSSKPIVCNFLTRLFSSTGYKNDIDIEFFRGILSTKGYIWWVMRKYQKMHSWYVCVVRTLCKAKEPSQERRWWNTDWIHGAFLPPLSWYSFIWV